MPRTSAAAAPALTSLPTHLTLPKSRSTSLQPSASLSQPPPPPSPLVLMLRQDWRWAAISQFLWTFGDGLGLTSSGWDIDALEKDLDSPEEDRLIPDILVKLLYALTYDKKVNRSNLEYHLDQQYSTRSPGNNPFFIPTPATTDLNHNSEPSDPSSSSSSQQIAKPAAAATRPRDPPSWAELGLSSKITILHDLCEWQLSDPAKFRALLKTDSSGKDGGEVEVNWRIEPCGWDKEGNEYWLFDDDRMWVKHPPPPETKHPKSTKASHKKGKGKTIDTSTNSKSKSASNAKALTSDQSKKSHRKKDRPQPVETSSTLPTQNNTDRLDPKTLRQILGEDSGLRSSGRRSTRNLESNAIARAAEAADPSAPIGKRTRTRAGNGLPMTLTGPNGGGRVASGTGSAPETPSKRPRTGGRGSYRLRGVEEEEEVWQEIPEEWLSPEKRNAESQPEASGSGSRSRKAVVVPSNGKEKRANGGRFAKKVVPDEQSKNSGKGGMMEDSESELSELSDSDDEGGFVQKAKVQMEEPVVEEREEVEDEKMDGAPELAEEIPQADASPVEVGGLGGQDRDQVPSTNIPQDPSGESETMPSQPDNEEGNSTVTADPADQSLQNPKVECEQGAPISNGVVPMDVDQPSDETKVDKQADEKPKVENPLPEVGPSKVEEIKIEDAKLKSIPAEVEEEIDPDDWFRLEVRKSNNRKFLEWEVVCANRWDWENFPNKFKGSKHKDEKAFYEHLTQNVAPGVIANFREKEIEAAKQEAIRNRKRSSRILLREIEQEEQKAAEDARREMEIRMQRVRDEEKRKIMEEEEKNAREREREERLREREDRLKQREEAAYEKALAETKAREKLELDRQRRAARREAGLPNAASDEEGDTDAGRSGKQKKRKADALDQAEEDGAEEDWELACEVCHQSGWNIDDGRPIVACELCARWQHQDCHDARDNSLGRPRRNWDQVDFFCAECRRRRARERKDREGVDDVVSPENRKAPTSAVLSPIKLKIPRQTEVNGGGLNMARSIPAAIGSSVPSMQTTPSASASSFHHPVATSSSNGTMSSPTQIVQPVYQLSERPDQAPQLVGYIVSPPQANRAPQQIQAVSRQESPAQYGPTSTQSNGHSGHGHSSASVGRLSYPSSAGYLPPVHATQSQQQRAAYPNMQAHQLHHAPAGYQSSVRSSASPSAVAYSSSPQAPSPQQQQQRYSPNEIQRGPYSATPHVGHHGSYNRLDSSIAPGPPQAAQASGQSLVYPRMQYQAPPQQQSQLEQYNTVPRYEPQAQSAGHGIQQNQQQMRQHQYPSGPGPAPLRDKHYVSASNYQPPPPPPPHSSVNGNYRQ